jgi:hypothetical protein
MASDQIEQSGNVTPLHAAAWVTDGVINDAGPASNGLLSGIGVTLQTVTGIGLGINNAPVTGPYQQLALGFGANGHGFLSLQNFGTAPAEALDIIVNGVTFTIGGTNWLSAIFDNQFGSAQGDLVYRDVNDWLALPPGTAGQVLVTGGPGANPSWSNVSGTGSVLRVGTGVGLIGGPITGTGTISLGVPVPLSLGGIGVVSLVPNGVVIGNGTGPITQASIGSIGFVLMSNGTVSPPSWIAASGTGTVTSISTVNGITGGPITVAGSIQLDPTTAPHPTINILSSSGLFTVPSFNGVVAQILEVELRGDGGGGGGSGANPVDGGTGIGTSFAGVVAKGGGGGGSNSQSGHPELGGIGGIGGTNGAGAATQRIAGQSGSPGQASTNAIEATPGGTGGGEGGGAGGYTGTTASPIAGAAGAPASGGGGGGATSNSSSLFGSGAGGGQGEYCLLFVNNVSVSYPFIVGTGGAAGTGSVVNGGTGGSGWIRVRASWL